MATITATTPIASGRNLLPDPRLAGAVMATSGGTMVDTHPAAGGPDGGSFFRRLVNAPNTTSPMQMSLAGSGVSGIPVTAGADYTMSYYARKSAGGPDARISPFWYDISGAFVSSPAGPNGTVGDTWQRAVSTVTAPAGAAFLRPVLAWSGIAVATQLLDFGCAQVERGSTASTFTDNQTITPLLVLDYGYALNTRNVVIEPLGSGYPTVFLRPAQSRSATLTLLFRDVVDAQAAESVLCSVSRFHFQAPEAAQDFHFVVTGAVQVTEATGTALWTVSAVFREVAP